MTTPDDRPRPAPETRSTGGQPVGPETIGPERPARDKAVAPPKNEPKLGPVDPARPAPKAWSTHERTGR